MNAVWEVWSSIWTKKLKEACQVTTVDVVVIVSHNLMVWF